MAIPPKMCITCMYYEEGQCEKILDDITVLAGGTFIDDDIRIYTDACYSCPNWKERE